jgi:hypothetical protein
MAKPTSPLSEGLGGKGSRTSRRSYTVLSKLQLRGPMGAFRERRVVRCKA